MHALLVSVGTAGDVFPLIALGAELRRRGHRVTFASAEPFGEAARRAGLEFHALMAAADYAALFESPDFWRPIRGARMLFEGVCDLMRPTFDFIASHQRPGETVVLASSLAIGGRIARDVFRLPLVTVHLSPVMLQSRHAAPIIPGLVVPDWLPESMKWKLQMGSDKHFTTRIVQPRLNAYRAELGLKPVGRVRHWWNSPRRVFLMFPKWFCAPQADWPTQIRQFGFPASDVVGAEAPKLDPALRAFLDAGPRPVVVTFSSARLRTAGLYRAAVEGCLKQGLRCVVLSRQPFAPPPGHADRVFVASYAPLSRVLPKAAALVHHGGIGTAAAAFAAGVPQLVIPLGFDQFDNAARVEELGCGAAASRYLQTGRGVARRLAALLGSRDVATRCAEVAALCAGRNDVRRACNAVELFFRRARRRGPAALDSGSQQEAVEPEAL